MIVTTILSVLSISGLTAGMVGLMLCLFPDESNLTKVPTQPPSRLRSLFRRCP